MSKKRARPKAINWNARLANTARRLIKADPAQNSLTDVLKKGCPAIYAQLRQIVKNQPWLKLWGRCRNHDDLADEQIVHPAILSVIEDLAGVEMKDPLVHAGLQHTYGYLFSLVKTPYGHKRDRWVQPDLENGFGISTPTLRPNPTAGSLLNNLTYFLGRIAWQGREKEIRLLRQYKHLVSTMLTSFGYRKQKRCGILETIRAKTPGQSQRQVRIFTHLIPVPHPSNVRYLLIYWYDDPAESNAKLLTAFPATVTTFDELASQPMGHNVVIRVRFNGYVKGIEGSRCKGKREVIGII